MRRPVLLAAAALVALVVVAEAHAQRPRPTAETRRASFDTRTRLRLSLASGENARLRVSGSRLDRLRRFRVESGGRRVRGLRVSVMSSGPEEIAVEFTLDGGITLSPERPYELVAFDGRRRVTVPLEIVMPPVVTRAEPSRTAIRVVTSPLRMTGVRFPIEIETPTLRMTGQRFPIEVETPRLRMTGNREETP